MLLTSFSSLSEGTPARSQPPCRREPGAGIAPGLAGEREEPQRSGVPIHQAFLGGNPTARADLICRLFDRAPIACGGP
jgi:hypothetical protein